MSPKRKTIQQETQQGFAVAPRTMHAREQRAMPLHGAALKRDLKYPSYTDGRASCSGYTMETTSSMFALSANHRLIHAVKLRVEGRKLVETQVPTALDL